MRNGNLRFALCIIIAALAPGCGNGSGSTGPSRGPVPKGNRVISLDVRPAEAQNYDAAFAKAKSAGMQSVTLSLDWGTVEPTAGQFDFTYVDIADLYYPAAGVMVGLSVRPVATNYRTLPVDIASRTLDDPVVIDRFTALLDSLRAHLGAATLSGIYIGSEHDLYFGTDASAWAQWDTFYAATRTHAKVLWPTVPVGTEFTYEGLTGTAASYTHATNAQSDVIVVSFYPLAGNFQVQTPGTVGTGIDAVAAAYPGRPIHFNQVGYPSSSANGSSEEKQRQFIEALFAAWDAHATQVRLINIDFQTDLSQADVDAFQNLYNLHDPNFAEFLRTLGLRRYPGLGNDKPAWTELVTQAAARGW